MFILFAKDSKKAYYFINLKTQALEAYNKMHTYKSTYLLLMIERHFPSYIMTNCLYFSFAVDTSIITKVKIPPYVILGSTVHLYCVFDLQNGTDIYMLKWLKNDEEFYRTVPKAVLRPNQRRTFHIDGVKVDIENSKVLSKNILSSFCNVVNKSSDLYYNCYNQIQDTCYITLSIL